MRLYIEKMLLSIIMLQVGLQTLHVFTVNVFLSQSYCTKQATVGFSFITFITERMDKWEIVTTYVASMLALSLEQSFCKFVNPLQVWLQPHIQSVCRKKKHNIPIILFR